MATVFIVNKGGHDYSDAKRFGRLVFLSEGPLNKYAVSQIYRKFSMQLRTSTPDDYIMLTGLTGMACIACAIFSFLHGCLNILLYKNGRYLNRKLIMGELLAKGDSTKDIADVIGIENK